MTDLKPAVRSKLNFNEMLALKSNITNISSAISYRNKPVVSNERFKSIVSQQKQKDKIYSNSTYFTNLLSVTVSEHSVERWNARVGPEADRVMLQQLFEYVLTYEPSRINIISYNFAYLDDYICFNYKLNDGHLTIVTIHGRSNLRPGIAHIANTLRFNATHDDRVDLDLTEEELSVQVFPEMPAIVLNYEIDDLQYQLLYFANENEKGNILIAEKEAKLKCEIIHAFSLNALKQKHYSYNILYLLVELGFVYSVVKNLLHQHDLLEELKDEYKKPAIRTFKNWLSKVRARDMNE